ncbi:NAD-dependent epimerase/dehydratase family protein [Chelativorans sp. ZYF759]|uniref:NAD-dependent epimerase/dehydratase family protein n=1 Tax=Chelativorans sp. ZYF759 TaxID=2692213 RepID=UPI00145C7C69|nr:NAD(P)-dependent oxidoreductase [Chelativorans sp. ZYF759]NMG41816.1 NAD-dependent epimerase/dehydratase family protein [Chelativorans sp. ZYF759]
MAKILVTGAGGMLGGAIVDELREHGHEVAGLDRRKGEADIAWHVGDMTDRALVDAAAAGQDAIIHVAALPNIWSGTGEELIRINVVGTWQVLDAAEQAGVRRVVICSSDSVVGYTVREGAMLPPLYLPVDESHPRRATDPYGLSKVLNEDTGRSFALRGKIEVVSLRPVFVAYEVMYGELRARAADPDNYTPRMAGGPSGAGGGMAWHYVEPRDAARAFRLALNAKVDGFEEFFLSASNTLAPEPTLERLERILGYLPEVRNPELYENNPYAPLYDLTKAREQLGFEAEIDLRTVLDLDKDD